VSNDALVLFSGGQDSTTCLLWALDRHFDAVHAVSFDYGQRHRVELDQAQHIMELVSDVYRSTDISYHVLPVPALSELAGAALTASDIAVEAEASPDGGNAYAAERGLPSTFVPGRNAILLSTAAALAAKLGTRHIVTGICAMDRAGYPDCRAEFAAAMESALRLALDWVPLTLHTPLLYLSKARTWALAEEVAGDWGVELVRRQSHTCYEGDRSVLHPWGYGCADCPACQTRAEGWQQYQAVPA
jgi:7-cyano-7-deazaguanine synthase